MMQQGSARLFSSLKYTWEPGAPSSAGAPDPPVKAKGKAAAKRVAKPKAGSAENPKAVWDIRKARLSTMDRTAFPIVDRGATKKLVEAVLLAKVPCL